MAQDQMKHAAVLAGYLASYSLSTLFTAKTVTPTYATYAAGEISCETLPAERLEDGVQAGKLLLSKRDRGVTAKALVYDGRITVPSGKKDALLVEARLFSKKQGHFTIAVPYTPNQDKSTSFAVHRMKIVEISQHLEDSQQELVEALEEGIGLHEPGAALWKRYLDASF